MESAKESSKDTVLQSQTAGGLAWLDKQGKEEWKLGLETEREVLSAIWREKELERLRRGRGIQMGRVLGEVKDWRMEGRK